MAHAGGACSAYWLKWNEATGMVESRSTTCLRSECAKVAEAVVQLRAGETVMVAGSDVFAVRQAMGRGGEDGARGE